MNSDKLVGRVASSKLFLVFHICFKVLDIFFNMPNSWIENKLYLLPSTISILWQAPPQKKPNNFQLSSSITLNTLNSWQCLHNNLSELFSLILQLIKRISIYLLCVTVLNFGTTREKEANFTFPCGVNW